MIRPEDLNALVKEELEQEVKNLIQSIEIALRKEWKTNYSVQKITIDFSPVSMEVVERVMSICVRDGWDIAYSGGEGPSFTLTPHD